jgi:hypothetical protein
MALLRGFDDRLGCGSARPYLSNSLLDSREDRLQQKRHGQDGCFSSADQTRWLDTTGFLALSGFHVEPHNLTDGVTANCHSGDRRPRFFEAGSHKRIRRR